MGVGTSIVVFAVGAILKFATNVHNTSFNIQTIGVILMIVGIVGFIVSLIFWASWGGYGLTRRRSYYRSSGGVVAGDPRYVDPRYGAGAAGAAAPGRRTVVEEEERGF